MKRTSILASGILLAIAILISAGQIRAQATEFVYQGQLQNASAAATGSFDFQFLLYDASVGGNQIGVTLTKNEVTVANGVFSVPLDFGSNYPGASRFLEIHVRETGGGAFTVLTPRQAVSSTPYSVKSLSATTATNALNANAATTATNAATSVNFSGTLNGDVTGTQGAATVGRLQGRSVANTAPTDGQVLKFSTANNRWQPDTDNAGAGTITGVSPGTGLAGGGVIGTVSLSIANGGVGTAQLADNGVTDAKITSVGGSKVSGTVANTTNSTQLGGIAANQYVLTGDSRMSNARPPTAGSSNYIQNGTGEQPLSNFYISGNGRAAQDLYAHRGMSVDAAGSFDGSFASLGSLRFGNIGTGSGEGIASKRTVGGNRFGLEFYTGHLSRLSITNSGNVGIGTNAPGARLHVSGGAILLDNSQGLFLKNNVGTDKRGLIADPSGDFLRIGSGGPSGFSEIRLDVSSAGQAMAVKNNGNVGIGTDTPDQRLSVNGNASKSVGGTTWAVFSDERLKNIHGRFEPGLSVLIQLEPIRFEYKPDNQLGLVGSSMAVGFSAQEVAKVLPEAVTLSDKGYLQLNSDPILWTMLNAIKEQQAQIEAQEKQIERHAAMNRAQQDEIAALKSLVCARNDRAEICSVQK